MTEKTKETHQDSEVHIVKPPVYLAIFFSLLVLTALTTGISFIDLGVFNAVIALAIACPESVLGGALFHAHSLQLSAAETNGSRGTVYVYAAHQPYHDGLHQPRLGHVLNARRARQTSNRANERCGSTGPTASLLGSGDLLAGHALGILQLIYFPVAALTSIVGSSWLEVFVIFAGGMLTFSASIAAFYQRRIASRLLLTGGIVLLGFAIGGQFVAPLNTRGIPNLLLLFLSGAVAVSLGLFGAITDRKGWPSLRDLP